MISLALGVVQAADGSALPVDKTYQVAASVLYDAVFVPGGKASVDLLSELNEVALFLAEAFKHGKAIGASGEGTRLLPAEKGAPGIVTGESDNMKVCVADFIAAIGEHRFPDREPARGGLAAGRRR